MHAFYDNIETGVDCGGIETDADCGGTPRACTQSVTASRLA
jgi:hypothetical protein